MLICYEDEHQMTMGKSTIKWVSSKSLSQIISALQQWKLSELEYTRTINGPCNQNPYLHKLINKNDSSVVISFSTPAKQDWSLIATKILSFSKPWLLEDKPSIESTLAPLASKHNFPPASATISFPGRLSSTSSSAIVSLKRAWMLGIWIWWRRISTEGFGRALEGRACMDHMHVGRSFLVKVICVQKESMLNCHQLCHLGSDFDCTSHLTVYNQAGKHMLPSPTISPLFRNSTNHLGIANSVHHRNSSFFIKVHDFSTEGNTLWLGYFPKTSAWMKIGKEWRKWPWEMALVKILNLKLLVCAF